MKCSFGTEQEDGCEGRASMAVCGVDSDGFIYRQRGHKVRCNVDGRWESTCDKSVVTEPICVAQPCLGDFEVTEAKTIEYSTDKLYEYYNEGTTGNLTECEEHYVPLAGNIQGICDAGNWVGQLECTLRDQTCSIKNLVKTAETLDNFKEIDESCPGVEKKDDENIYGGEACAFNCTTPYYPSGPLVCRQGEWSGSAKCG